jgi:solute carrier family 25 citrate transporter 1
MVSGGITGAIEICITYPTEFIKTMQQLYSHLSKLGTVGCAKQIVAERGFFGLYRGLSCLLFFAVPKTGTRFGAKEFYDIHVFGGNSSSINSFLSGAMAGTTEAFIVVTPMETLKVKIIHD